MRIRGAIFDMDGTVIDSLTYWGYFWRRIGERYMGDGDFVPCDEVNQGIRTMLYADAMAYIKEYYAIPGETADFVRFAADGISEFYEKVAKPKAGAVEILTALKQEGIPVCLASATAMPEIRHALSCHGLLEYFDLVLSCADIGVGKERPDIYLMASEKMGLAPSELCVVEDSFLALETAKRAGFQTVGVYDRYSPNQERLKRAADLYVTSEQTLCAIMDWVREEK